MSARREMTEGIDPAAAEVAPEPIVTRPVAVAGSISGPVPTPDEPAPAGAERATSLVSATHAALFVADEAVRCDVCDTVVAEDADDGYAVSGRGLYVWARGEDVRHEEPHLCTACAAAVGVSALARWEIEEEEG